MRFQLTKNEKEKINREYERHPLFLYLRRPCQHLRSRAKRFGLSPEEAFLCSLHYLDLFKETPVEAPKAVAGLWDELVCEFRDYAEDGNDAKEDIELAAGTILYVLFVVLNQSDVLFYRRLSRQIITCLNDGRGELVYQLQQTFLAELDDTALERLSQFIQSYMDSDEFLSDDIGEMLAESVPLAIALTDENKCAINDKVSILDKTGTYNLDYAVNKERLLASLYSKANGWGHDKKRWTVVYQAFDKFHLHAHGYAQFVRGVIAYCTDCKEADVRSLADKIRLDSLNGKKLKEWENEYLILFVELEQIIQQALIRI